MFNNCSIAGPGWRIKTPEGMESKLDILADQLMKALKLKDPAE